MAMPKHNPAKELLLRSSTSSTGCNYEDTHLGSDREPSVVGERVSMWRVNFRPTPESKGTQGAVIGMWLFSMLKDSPNMPYKAATLLDLKKMEDAFRMNPKAEYELVLTSLDPRHRVPNLEELETLATDQPLMHCFYESDLLLQFQGAKGVTPEQAVSVVDGAIEHLVKNTPIETGDWRVDWAHVIFDRIMAMIQTPIPTVN